MESAFNPTGEVLTLFYDLILSNAKSAENTLSNHNYLLARGSLEEEVKKYVTSYVAFFAFQEKNVKTEEMAFIHEIINDNCKLDIKLILDSIDDSCFTYLMECFCLADIYRKEEKSMALDLFNFSEEVGQAFLNAFATPNRVIFYNSFMEYLQKYAQAKDDGLKGRLEFRKNDSDKPQIDYNELIENAKESIRSIRNDKEASC